MKGKISKVIIGVHGLGNKPFRELLQEWWYKSIIEGLHGLDEKVDLPSFELIYWADILNSKPLDETITDVEDLYYLDEKYCPAPLNYKPEDHPIRRKIMGFIEKYMDKMLVNTDLTLRFPGISDAVINKYFYELGLYFNNTGIARSREEAEARKFIRRRVASAIRKYQGCEIFLVAHSMGSIVAYDVLSLDIPEVNIAVFVTIGSPLGIPVVLSKIANSEEYRLLGHKKPKTPPGVESWYNFSDPDDRIAFDHILSDDFEENEEGIRPLDVSVFNNYINNGLRNPHKSFGYLRSKAFSEVLHKFIGEEKAATSTLALGIVKWFKKIVYK